MTESEWTGDLTQEAIADGMKQAAKELQDWINGSLDADIRKRGIQIAREKAEGVYREKQEQEFLNKTFAPGSDLNELQKANARLSELLDLPHRNKTQEAEMQKLLKTVQGSMKRYSPSGKARE